MNIHKQVTQRKNKYNTGTKKKKRSTKLTALRNFLIKAIGFRFNPRWNLTRSNQIKSNKNNHLNNQTLPKFSIGNQKKKKKVRVRATSSEP